MFLMTVGLSMKFAIDYDSISH